MPTHPWYLGTDDLAFNSFLRLLAIHHGIMATFQPPPSYTAQQLAALYPSSLELRQVQVIFRHGCFPVLYLHIHT